MDWFRKFSVLFGLGLLVASMLAIILAGTHVCDVHSALLAIAIAVMVCVPAAYAERPGEGLTFWSWMMYAMSIVLLMFAVLPWNTQAGWTWANWTWRLVLLLLAPLAVLVVRWIRRDKGGTG